MNFVAPDLNFNAATIKVRSATRTHIQVCIHPPYFPSLYVRLQFNGVSIQQMFKNMFAEEMKNALSRCEFISCSWVSVDDCCHCMHTYIYIHIIPTDSVGQKNSHTQCAAVRNSARRGDCPFAQYHASRRLAGGKYDVSQHECGPGTPNLYHRFSHNCFSIDGYRLGL